MSRKLTEAERLEALNLRPPSTWRGDLAAGALFLVWVGAIFFVLIAGGE